MKRLLLALLALLLLGAPALAADSSGRIGLSWDGTSWVTQLDGTLFNRPGSVRLWVPGDSDTQHFYVRDQSGDAARLAIDYSLPPDSLLSPSDFRLSARVDGGPVVALTPGTGWLPLDGTTLRDRQHVDVAVTAVFDAGSTNQSQSESFPLDFRVTLSQIAGPASDSGAGRDQGGDDDGGGPLPDTGAPRVRWAIVGGLFCLGGGLAIVVIARRKEDEDAVA